MAHLPKDRVLPDKATIYASRGGFVWPIRGEEGEGHREEIRCYFNLPCGKSRASGSGFVSGYRLICECSKTIYCKKWTGSGAAF